LRATLTHARCDAVLEEQVVRDIRMLQHQVGMCDRADLQRMAELADENGVLARELGGAQQRAPGSRSRSRSRSSAFRRKGSRCAPT